MKTICFMLLCLAVAYAAPVSSQGRKEGNLQLVQKYLEKYYNFTSDGQPVFRQKANSPLVKKIKEMQKFMGLQVTGNLDSNTLEAIQKPRCGNPDVGGFGFFPGQPKWEKTDLTYRIVNHTPDMDSSDVYEEIAKAFKVWSRVTPLTFKPVQAGDADIMITFAEREHGDFNPFDGPGGTVAHAYAPSRGIGGDAHFDEDEKWTNSLEGSNLFFVAAHEFGHSLGLYHSQDPQAVMFPVYNYPQLTQDVLSQDDIEGIQFLYGSTPNPPEEDPVEDDIPTVPARPTQPAIPTACDPHLTFDAVTNFRGEMLFFKDKYFWRKHPRYAELDFSLISTFWPFLTSGVDAVSENSDKDVAFLFKGNQFWAVKGDSRLPGYPKRIHTLGFPKDVKKIDAAFYNSNEKTTYYFSSDRYWRYDEASQTIDKKPTKIRDGIPGVNGKVDAAFQHNGFFYFFSGTNQHEFDPNSKRVTRITRANSWFPCRG
ncbi:stromelysin-1-like [Lacerta agilis]|uniref:stromelysin-1-like n=1 Tax=Lacerta agilis TaxID=80427 RepID=UPI001419FECA|nr:stromelysin-1-like [Lacerta agilis]